MMIQRRKIGNEPPIIHTSNNTNEHDYKYMTTSQMVLRQLSLFRFKKNVDPSWKQKAIDGAVPFYWLMVYVASSFFYSAAGMVLLLFQSIYFPFHSTMGLYFVVQGFVTHCSDTLYVDQGSIWHPVDRVLAWIGICFISSSLVVLLTNTDINTNSFGTIIYLGGAVLSTICFGLEWKYKAEGNISGFVICHSLWHMLAPTGLMIMVLLYVDG